eukprot:jgi/Bigna1/137409/aug1.39_g12117
MLARHEEMGKAVSIINDRDFRAEVRIREESGGSETRPDSVKETVKILKKGGKWSLTHLTPSARYFVTVENLDNPGSVYTIPLAIDNQNNECKVSEVLEKGADGDDQEGEGMSLSEFLTSAIRTYKETADYFQQYDPIAFECSTEKGQNTRKSPFNQMKVPSSPSILEEEAGMELVAIKKMEDEAETTTTGATTSPSKPSDDEKDVQKHSIGVKEGEELEVIDEKGLVDCSTPTSTVSAGPSLQSSISLQNTSKLRRSPDSPSTKAPGPPKVELMRSSSDNVVQFLRQQSPSYIDDDPEKESLVLCAVYLEPDPSHFHETPALTREGVESIVHRVNEERQKFRLSSSVKKPGGGGLGGGQSSGASSTGAGSGSSGTSSSSNLLTTKHKEELAKHIRSKFEQEVNAHYKPLLVDKNTALRARRTVVPQRTSINEDVLNYIPMGAWPDGCKLKIRTTAESRRSLRSTSLHMFVSKQYRGAQDYYCYCVTKCVSQYKMLTAREIQYVRNQQRVWAICLQDFFECSEEFRNMNQLGDNDVYAPYSLVLITKHPFHDTMISFLKDFFNKGDGEKKKGPVDDITPPIVAEVWSMVKNLTIPPPGGLLKMPGGLRKHQPLRIPEDDKECCDTLLDMDLTFLLRRLDASLVVMILNQLSVEHSVLIVSKSISKLTYCVECARALLYPVSWQFPTYHTFLAPEYDMLVVDVDNNLYCVIPKDTPILKALRDALWIPGANARASKECPFPLDVSRELRQAISTHCRRSSENKSYMIQTEHQSRRLNRLVKMMRSLEFGIKVKDRTYYMDTYKGCFIGSEAVNWVMKHEGVSRSVAVAICERICIKGHFSHVLGECMFQDDYKFYRWVPWHYNSLFQRLKEPGSGVALYCDQDLRNGYPFYLTGQSLVDWMVTERVARTRAEAVQIGEGLRKYHLLKPVHPRSKFSDSPARLQYTSDVLMRTAPVEALDLGLLHRFQTHRGGGGEGGAGGRGGGGGGPSSSSQAMFLSSIGGGGLPSSPAASHSILKREINQRKQEIARLDAEVFNTVPSEGIQKAEYGWTTGKSSTNKYQADVTNALRHMSHSGWLVLYKGLRLSKLFRFDPCKSWPKMLKISYWLSGVKREVVIADPIVADRRIQVGTAKHWLRDAHYTQMKLHSSSSGPLLKSRTQSLALDRDRPPIKPIDGFSSSSSLVADSDLQAVAADKTSASTANNDTKESSSSAFVRGGKESMSTGEVIREAVAVVFLKMLNGYEYFVTETERRDSYSIMEDIKGGGEQNHKKRHFDRQRFLMSRIPTHRQFLKQFCQTQAFAGFVKNDIPKWAKKLCIRYFPLPKATSIHFTVTDRDTLFDELSNIPPSGPFLHVHLRGMSHFRKRGRWGVVVSLVERGSGAAAEIGRTELKRYPPQRSDLQLTLKNVEYEEVVPMRRGTARQAGNYGVKGNMLWVDSGCKAVFEVTSLLASTTTNSNASPR